MNAKQSLKQCAQRLQDVETVLKRAERDIKMYNRCIDSMIAGGSPCEFCEDHEECKKAENGKAGCSDWWLAYDKVDAPADGPESDNPLTGFGG